MYEFGTALEEQCNMDNIKAFVFCFYILYTGFENMIFFKKSLTHSSSS